MANKRLLTVQAGKETTPFTAVTATVKRGLLEVPEFNNDNEGELLIGQTGTLSPGDVALVNSQSSSLAIGGTATYEDLPYELDALCGVATPSGSGTYTYAHNGQLAAIPSVRVQTFEIGDQQSASANYRLAGCHLKSLEITQNVKEAAKFKAEYIGGVITSQALTAALSYRALNPLHYSHLTFFLDTWAGTLGATALTATMYQYALKIDTKRNLGWLLGALTPEDVDHDTWDVTLDATMKFNATSKALVDALIGSTAQQRQLRIKYTDGTRIFQIDLPGTLTPKFKAWDDRSNTLLVKFTMRATYHATVANYLKFSTTNGVTTLA